MLLVRSTINLYVAITSHHLEPITITVLTSNILGQANMFMFRKVCKQDHHHHVHDVPNQHVHVQAGARAGGRRQHPGQQCRHHGDVFLLYCGIVVKFL